MCKHFLSLLCMLLILGKVQSQDHIYSQAFLSPLYLNPAAAGTADNDLRVNAIFRKQWINVPGGMNYFTASLDKYVRNLSGGVGLMATTSYEGFIQRTNFAGAYSFEICNSNWELRMGLQAGVSNRRLNYDKLIFSDQLDQYGIIPGSVSAAEIAINNRKYYPDFGGGALFFYRNKLMVSGSANHINQPDESFTNNTESKLPIRWNGALRYLLETENLYIVPGATYYRQSTNQSWSIGCDVKSHYVNVGLWYRGNVNFQGSNAWVVTLTLDNFLGRGENNDKMRFGMAYDATTGPLTFSRTAGSLEGAFEYQALTNQNWSAENRCRAELDKRGSTKCYGGFW